MPNLKSEIDSLAAETLALQALVSGLFLSLQNLSGGKEAVSQAFAFADLSVENVAMSGQGSASHTTRALEILDQIRAISQ
ncbi:MAG: hypothetical protein HEP70_00910 [Rhodobiaceae bacterium]|nr:hypothetical protein [Rhodobiaceae bacterium]